MQRSIIAIIITLLLGAHCPAAEVVQLTSQNWDQYVPQGKEIDAIYGDYVIRNDVLTAVIAQPKSGRNANLTVRNVYGGVLDLTRLDDNNDQLSCFYPTNQRFTFTDAETVRINYFRDLRATLTFTSLKREDGMQARVIYLLSPGANGLSITTEYINHSDQTREVLLQDGIRADTPFTAGIQDGMYWTNDSWFRQAYGLVAHDYSIARTGGGGRILTYNQNETNSLSVPAGKIGSLDRVLTPGGSLLSIQAAFAHFRKTPTANVQLDFRSGDQLVNNAHVRVLKNDTFYGDIRSDAFSPHVRFDLPHGKYKLECASQGRPDVTLDLTVNADITKTIDFKPCGYLEARVTNDSGKPIGCKISFHGVGETATPDFGPKQAAVRALNLYYALRGHCRQELLPGTYELIFSHGPEHDAVIKTVEIKSGEVTRLDIELAHVIHTHGWISTDYHTHSSPSGDNTSVQIGRVITLICEQIDYAPCTEHQRVDSYTPLLKELGVEHLMGTATGMELTGRVLPVNHQNAFPLKHIPRTQDGGGPTIEDDPVRQIAKLAGWNDNAFKLVQEDHPALMQIYRDRDADNKADQGFREMFQYMDVMEVHPLQSIFDVPDQLKPSSDRTPVMFYWMQMLNLGYRIPGVVNSDSHYNDHGAGYIRNYVKSPTDHPGRVRTRNVVSASKAGNVVMTNGPYLEVTIDNGSRKSAIAGEDLIALDAKVNVHIKIQCPNWLDVNRVQIFLNGRMAENLNFTRRTHAPMFGNGVVKYQATIPVELTEDTHIIVATVGEGLLVGRVQGPRFGELMPTAVANPVFVDIDGDGFGPNRDNLGVDISVK